MKLCKLEKNKTLYQYRYAGLLVQNEEKMWGAMKPLTVGGI
jgi:hypothetical protein